MPIKQIVYNCQYCNKCKLTTKEKCEKHESFCFKNPKNKACLTCIFFKRRRRTSEEKDFSRGDIYECSKLKLNFYRTTDNKRINESLETKEVLKEINELVFSHDKKDREMLFPKRDCSTYIKK